MKVFILGGGPAGMATAEGLAAAGIEFVLVEREATLGGLARTMEWPGVGAHDLGPHKIFTLDQALARRVEGLLPQQDWLTREKRSSIFMRGHYLPYPPSPFSLAGVFGMGAFAAMVAGYGLARLSSPLRRALPGTFEEDLARRVGRPLYERLFRPIALKLWGDPNDLDVKLSRARVQTPGLAEVLARVAGLRRTSAFEALEFRYPRGGLGRLWDAIEARAGAHGRFLRGHAVTALATEGGRVTAIECAAPDGPRRLEVAADDFVVSTLPLALLVRLLGPSLSDEAVALASRVVALNDLYLVFLHVDRQSLIDESWIFVPDPDIAFHRLSEQESFDPAMTPDGSIVCCEMMSGASRDLTSLGDAELRAAAEAGLARMGISGFTVRAHRVVRLPRSYPVYRAGYEQGLTRLVGELDQLPNLRSAGRQGAFNYIGTMDAMDIGYGMAEWLAGRGARDWRLERERTNHYPVLD